MPKYVFLALTNPAPGKEAEYNEWYDKTHLADVLNVPGFVSAQRFRLNEPEYALNKAQSHKYLALYEMETNDIAGSLKELSGRIGSPAMVMTDALDMNALGAFVFAPIGGKVLAKDVKRS